MQHINKISAFQQAKTHFCKMSSPQLSHCVHDSFLTCITVLARVPLAQNLVYFFLQTFLREIFSINSVIFMAFIDFWMAALELVVVVVVVVAMIVIFVIVASVGHSLIEVIKSER